MKVKSIKFNLKNSNERELYSYAIQQHNFSGWMKHLIREEIRNRNSIPVYKSDEDGVIRIHL